MPRSGVFPGSFDPLTVAHLAIAEAAHRQLGLTSLDLVISSDPLAKDHRRQSDPSARVEAIVARPDRPSWLSARITHHRLLVDIARGHDVLVIGADKWRQLHDPAFYGSSEAMAAALAELPTVAVAPRAGEPAPQGDRVVVLELDPGLSVVSSSAVRAGRGEWRA